VTKFLKLGMMFARAVCVRERHFIPE